jgi:hypothetical protein
VLARPYQPTKPPPAERMMILAVHMSRRLRRAFHLSSLSSSSSASFSLAIFSSSSSTSPALFLTLFAFSICLVFAMCSESDLSRRFLELSPLSESINICCCSSSRFSFSSTAAASSLFTSVLRMIVKPLPMSATPAKAWKMEKILALSPRGWGGWRGGGG